MQRCVLTIPIACIGLMNRACLYAFHSRWFHNNARLASEIILLPWSVVPLASRPQKNHAHPSCASNDNKSYYRIVLSFRISSCCFLVDLSFVCVKCALNPCSIRASLACVPLRLVSSQFVGNVENVQVFSVTHFLSREI
jgi:hypothetical protein